MKQKVLIVGAGIGGLATALRLAKAGYEVEIVEKNAQAGGRLNQIKKEVLPSTRVRASLA